ncbi:hypothetical protein D3C80_924670 [compost metagenome]
MRRVLGVQYEDARLVVAIEDGGGGHHGCRLGPGGDRGAGEHARLQAAARRQGDAGQTQAGLGVDLGCDDADGAAGGDALVRGDGGGLAGAQGGQVGFRHLGVQFQTTFANHAEQLGSGGDDLALGDAAADNQARDRRLDLALGQAGAGLGQRRLGRGQIGGGGALVGQGRIQRGLAEEAARLQFLSAGQGGVVPGGVGLGGLHPRLLLAQLGLQQGVVQLDQNLALTDVGAFIDIDADGGQAAGLGADRHFLPGRDRSRGHDDARQGLFDRRGDADGLARGAGFFTGLGLVVVPAAGGQGQGGGGGQKQGRGTKGFRHVRGSLKGSGQGARTFCPAPTRV